MPEKHYDVGYGKPPKSGQFKKGQSGNPSGKKAPVKLEDIFKHALAKPVSITVDGKKQSLPMLAVIVEALMRKAAGGNIAAIKAVVTTVATFVDEPVANISLNAHQLALLKDIMATIELSDDE